MLRPRPWHEHVAAYNAAFDLIQPQLTPKLHALARFVALENLGMGLKEAHEFRRGGHALALEHSADRLAHASCHPWQDLLEALRQPLPLLPALGPQPAATPLRLPLPLAPDREQLLVGLPDCCLGCGPLSTGQPVQPLGYSAGPAGPRAEYGLPPPTA